MMYTILDLSHPFKFAGMLDTFGTLAFLTKRTAILLDTTQYYHYISVQ